MLGASQTSPSRRETHRSALALHECDRLIDWFEIGCLKASMAFHLGTAVAALLLTVPAARAQNNTLAQPPRSVWDSVYSEDQAGRGEAAFRRVCTACHTATQFTGPGFLAAWRGAAVYQLFDLIRTTMPDDLPGSLPLGTYADIVAYILKLNRYPSGQRELPGDSDSLKLIRIEPPRSP